MCARWGRHRVLSVNRNSTATYQQYGQPSVSAHTTPPSLMRRHELLDVSDGADCSHFLGEAADLAVFCPYPYHPRPQISPPAFRKIPFFSPAPAESASPVPAV